MPRLLTSRGTYFAYLVTPCALEVPLKYKWRHPFLHFNGKDTREGCAALVLLACPFKIARHSTCKIWCSFLLSEQAVLELLLDELEVLWCKKLSKNVDELFVQEAHCG